MFLGRYLHCLATLLLQTVRGTIADNISSDVIRSLEFLFLSIEEQQRIAGVLDKADAIRRKRHEAVLTINVLRVAFSKTFR